MALEQFKNIEEVINKGTSLTTELDAIDLALIDRGFKATPFNIGVNDVLEFVLYDSANNLLEQKDYGKIRYLKGVEINNYLIRSENIIDKQQDGGGFLIDVKKLIKDAGFNIGVFRVQLNFVNDRVGSSMQKDKLWIHEISPTRLELRLLPFDNFNDTAIDRDTKIDLNQAYNSFVVNKFSGDEVYSEIDEILNRLNPANLMNSFQKFKNINYINQLASEFGINSFEIFFSKVLESMKSAVRHALLHKNSVIGSNQFGKDLGDSIDFTYYNKSDITRLLNNKFEEAVDYHLPKRTLSDQVKLDNVTQQSIDRLQDLVQRLSSDRTNTNPNYQKYITNPPTIQEIKDQFVTEKIVVTNPSDSKIQPVIEVPVLITPPENPINVIFEPETTDEAIEKDRLRRLQEEMMYLNEGGRGTRFEVPYESPYSQPAPSINTGGEPIRGGGGVVNERLSNEDYIRSFEQNNREQAN